MVLGAGQPAVGAQVPGKDRIEIAATGAVIEFERDASGLDVAAVLRQNGEVLRG